MENEKIKLFKMLTLLALVAVIFVGVEVATVLKSYRFIGAGIAATDTISVDGEGEVLASPDIATISFSVVADAKKVSDAQGQVSTKVKAVLATIAAQGIADNDIKTENYSSYPKYEWQQGTQIPCANFNCPPPGKQVLVGYEVSQSVTVTVRDLDRVNGLVEALGNANVTDMQGPNFAIDKQDDLKAAARKMAIDKARAKADVLAHDLGVELVRVVSFSEGQNYPVYPGRLMSAAAVASAPTVPTPELPQGQQKITSNVTVTYEIR